MTDLTTKQVKRLDFVHNAIHDMLCAVAGEDIAWDISVIAEISDLAEDHICETLGLMKAMEFAPYIADDDYVPPIQCRCQSGDFIVRKGLTL